MKRDRRELVGTKMWIAEPVRKRTGIPRVALLAIAVLSLVFASAVGTTWVDLEFWKDAAPQARKALREHRSTDKQSIAAIAVLHRDVYESIELLRSAAQGNGPVADQARIALDDIQRQASNR